jgi:hypothetical protein
VAAVSVPEIPIRVASDTRGGWRSTDPAVTHICKQPDLVFAVSTKAGVLHADQGVPLGELLDSGAGADAARHSCNTAIATTVRVVTGGVLPAGLCCSVGGR